MDTFVAFLIIAAMIGLVGVSWWVSNRVDNSEYDTETDSSEDSPSTDIPMSWVTQGRKQDEQRRGNAASSRSTIPGAQRVDPTPMSDRRLWEQIEYNTRMSADVLHRMWVVVVISMVLSVIGGIAMSAFQ